MPESRSVAPIHTAELGWEEWSHGVRFGSRFKRLHPTLEDHHVGFLIEELAPGRQSCPLHYHLLEEEHVYVLDGTMTLRLGSERVVLKAGDYICFPAGHPEGHAFVNEGQAACRYLVVGENNKHDIAIYPDSDKIAIRSTGGIYARARGLDYWEGESSDDPPDAPVASEPRDP